MRPVIIKSDVVKVLNLVRGNKMNNVQNNEGDTPLHCACCHGHSDIVEILMLEGADETIINKDKETPALLTKEEEHTKLLPLLDRISF